MTRTEGENTQQSKSRKHGHKSRHSATLGGHRSPLAPLNDDLSTEERLRRAEEALHREKKKRRRAEKRARNGAKSAAENDDDTSVPPSNGSIPRPKCASKVKMSVIRSHLGYEKPKWNAYRLAVHEALFSARLDWKSNWRAQDAVRLGRAYDVIRADFPETERFQGLWGIDRVAKQYWDNRTSNERDKKNPNSYRSLHARRRSSPEPLRESSPSRLHRRLDPRTLFSSEDEGGDKDGEVVGDGVRGSDGGSST
ncbi:hypothetical protein FB45DRAFT_1105437 [Roridomyces roridus]|uniref:Uncharacterized protein n=1 Tax=Roridomyces roridus TaxID=1738132 RepID=A0AAD7AX13_9AGAR|nr:hypothetical protein FB45DRAFT_1105437 [Roridomyces roridus]